MIILYFNIRMIKDHKKMRFSILIVSMITISLMIMPMFTNMQIQSVNLEREIKPLYSSSPMPVNLGTAGNFAILTNTGITTTGTTFIVGNIGVSPIDSTAMTGFGLVLNGTYATSSLVDGKVYASDYAEPTPTTLGVAIGDKLAAYNDAQGRVNGTGVADFNELGAGEIGGLELEPGIYKWAGAVGITTNMTLNGTENDVWIFQIGTTLTVATSVVINLTGGALAKNVFWACGTIVSIGAGAQMKGIILSGGNINFNSGATLIGRALSSTQVTLISNIITAPLSEVVPLAPVAPVISAIDPNPDNDGNINLNWNDVADADSYKIYRYNDTITEINSSVSMIAETLSSEATAYQDSGLENDTYYYVIVAFNEIGNSSISNCVSVLVEIDGSYIGTRLPVNLGLAGDFVALAMSGISTTGTTSIVGNIGVSPIDSTAITGFSLSLVGAYSTSIYVDGNIYASDYDEPTPSVLTTAVANMLTAYTDAMGRTDPDATELGAGDVTGMTLEAGLYKWSSGLLISSGGVTLNGSENDVFIFQIDGDLTISNGAIIKLVGGVQPKNIFWAVAGGTIIGTTVAMKGIIMCYTAITMDTSASLVGRAFSQTAITLDANSITIPIPDSTSPIAPVLDNITPDPDLDGNIHLNWNDVIGATSYIVLRSNETITSDNYLIATVLSNTTTVSEYNDLNRTDGTYFYAVQAQNSTGKSMPSNSLSVEVIRQSTEGTSPSAPILDEIIPNPDVDGNIYLNWNDVVGATSYILFRHTAPITTGNVLLATVLDIDVVLSEYNDLLRPNGTYYYAVQSKNSSGTSLLSNNVQVIVSIATIGGDDAPNAPVLSTIIPPISLNGVIVLNWTDVEGALSYIVFRFNATITNENLASATIIANGLNVSEYIATDQPNGKWYYAIQAENATGISVISNVESVTINTPDPNPSWIWWVIGAIIAAIIVYIIYNTTKPNKVDFCNLPENKNLPECQE